MRKVLTFCAFLAITLVYYIRSPKEVLIKDQKQEKINLKKLELSNSFIKSEQEKIVKNYGESKFQVAKKRVSELRAIKEEVIKGDYLRLYQNLDKYYSLMINGNKGKSNIEFREYFALYLRFVKNKQVIKNPSEAYQKFPWTSEFISDYNLAFHYAFNGSYGFYFTRDLFNKSLVGNKKEVL